MNKTLLSSPQTLQDLQDFMFDTMASTEMALDWFCYRFDVAATDEVIDFVVDAHFAFFGEWYIVGGSFPPIWHPGQPPDHHPNWHKQP